MAGFKEALKKNIRKIECSNSCFQKIGKTNIGRYSLEKNISGYIDELDKNKYEIAGGLALAAVIAGAAATKDIGYAFERLQGSGQSTLMRLTLNPAAYPISNAIGEGVKEGHDELKLMGHVGSSLLKNSPYYLALGEGASFLTGGIVKKLRNK